MRKLLVEHLPVADLVPYARNARTHSREQIAVIAASIRKFGWTNPILIGEDDNIIAGHGRVLAAKHMGIENVPIIRIGGMSPAEQRAYVIADNQTALRAGWDTEVLKLELDELKSLDFDLGVIGFDDAELAGILDVRPIGATDPDFAPEPPVNPVAIRGDLWALGRHRLLCGDCTQPEAVDSLMLGQKAVLMNTDPPYGVDYAAVKNGIPRSGFQDIQARGGDIENDDLTDGVVLQAFLEASIRAAVPHLIVRAAFYFWHPMLTQGTFFAAAAAAAADILIHRQIIWVKPHMVLTRSGMYHWRHELCFYGWRRGNKPAWYGSKGQTSVWDDITKDQVSRDHPTQKPTELFERPIANHSKPGEIIYEPFAGSGSQIIAAEMTGRKCYAIEIAPKYIDTAIHRWELFTGNKATLASTGQTFDEVAKTRKRAA